MRLLVLLLIVLNLALGIWGGLGYWYSQGQQQYSGMNDQIKERPMPGAKLVMLKERLVEEDDGITKEIDGVTSSSSIHVGVPDLNDAAQKAEPAKVKSECVRFGPFSEAEVASVVVTKLKGFGIASTEIEMEKVAGMDFWVYIKPESTRELALARLRELQDKKIDSFIIPQGELENGISLGVYDKEQDAAAKQQEVLQQGYEAQVGPHQRKYKERWIRVSSEAAVALTDEVVRQLRELQPNMGMEKESCDEVAPVTAIQ